LVTIWVWREAESLASYFWDGVKKLKKLFLDGKNRILVGSILVMLSYFLSGPNAARLEEARSF
jgi:hypothetical protein